MNSTEAIKKDFHSIIRRCQTLNALVKRIAKLTESLPTAETNDIRRRRYISIQVGLEKLALQEHELHCEMVNLGIADYSADRYGNISLKLQFGESVLYFRKPEEESQVPVEQEKDMVQTPLEMAVEEAHRPDITGEEDVDEVVTQEHLDRIAEQVDEWEEESDEVVMARNEGRKVEATTYPAEAVVLSNKEKTKKKVADPKPEPPPAPVTMKLSEATKVWKQTGEVPEGFQVVGDNLYKKAAGKDPDRHVKPEPPAPPAEEVIANKVKEKMKPKPENVHTGNGKEEPVEKQPEQPKKPAVEGPFGNGGKATSDLKW